jgi:hypothetical protein
MGAELFQFNAARGVAAILLGCVARHTGRSLIGIGATLGAFEGDYESNVFTLGHHQGAQIIAPSKVGEWCGN